LLSFSLPPIINLTLNHGKEATEALKAFISEYYTFSDKPVFQALWNSYNECQFVDDESQTRVVVEKGALDKTGLSGDIVFYRDKKGQSVVKTGVQ
jgi:omega-6 fatty acid desaturase (delta-12 desaturase)